MDCDPFSAGVVTRAGRVGPGVGSVRHAADAVTLNAAQAALGELRAAWLLTTADQALYRTYANGAVTKSLRGQLVRADWCDLSECHLERFSASIVYEPKLSSTQRLKLYAHSSPVSKRGGCGVSQRVGVGRLFSSGRSSST